MKGENDFKLSQKKYLGWDQSILIFLIAIIILVPVVLYPYSTPVFEPAKSLVLNALSVFAFTLLVLKFIHSDHLSWHKTPLDKPVLIYLLFGSLSLIWSVNIYHSILALPMFFVGPVLFFVISNLIPEQKKINRLLFVIIIIGTVMGAYGILQYLGIDFEFWAGNVARQRVMGLFGNVNYFAEYLILPLTLSIGLFLSKEKVFHRFFLLIAVISMGATLLLTFTRGSYLAAGISLLVMLLLYHKSSSDFLGKRYGKKMVLYFVLLVIIVLSLIFIPHPLNQKGTLLARLRERVSITELTSGYSISRRTATWKFTWMMIEDSFILGSGLGTYDHLSLKYQADFFDLNGNRDIYPYEFAAQAHNEYLQIWSELGIIGLFWFLLILFLYYRTILIHLPKMKEKDKSVTIGLAGGVTAVLVDAILGFPFQLPASLSLFWIFIGLTVSQIVISNNKQEAFNRQGKRKTVHKIILSFLVITMMVVLTSFLVRPFMAHVYWYHGARQSNRGNDNQAIQLFEEGLKWNPWQGQFYYFIGNILASRNINTPALDYYLKAERFVDYHYLPQNIGSIYLKQGDISSALPYLEQAIKYQKDKKSMLQFELQLGNIYLTQKDYQNAERLFNSAIENKPDNAEAYYGLAQVYFSQDKKELGKETLKKVIELDPNSRVADYAGTLLKKYELEDERLEDMVE